jgi:hypothetical protein
MLAGWREQESAAAVMAGVVARLARCHERAERAVAVMAGVAAKLARWRKLTVLVHC